MRNFLLDPESAASSKNASPAVVGAKLTAGKPLSAKVKPLPSRVKARSYEELNVHDLVMDDSLAKYKPGMMGDPFVNRWCRLNKDSFKVYSGSEAFAPLSSRPTIEVSVANIAYVQRV